MSVTTPSVQLIGSPGSPYSRKMRALLRYRRISHQWILRNSTSEPADIPDVPVALIPILVLREADGSVASMIDSTPQIRRLEERFSERSVIPPDPVVAFLDALIEDFGDEWLTKAMFHYRWVYDADIAKAGAILPRWGRSDAPEDRMVAFGKMISERQISRLGVVGSNSTTAAVIESSYRRILQALDARLQQAPFVMGARPGSADFGLFGQLTQLALFDPTPAEVTLEVAPRVVAWCEVVEDLSGSQIAEADWVTRDTAAAALAGLLAEIGRVYTPFLLGNAAALESGASQVECEIDGRKWVQEPFPYQGKCLRWLRERHGALSAADRRDLDAILAGSGSEAQFA